MKPDTRLRVPRGRGRGRGRGPGARAEARGRAGAGAREARLDRPGGPGSLESARGQGQAPRATLLLYPLASSLGLCRIAALLRTSVENSVGKTSRLR